MRQGGPVENPRLNVRLRTAAVIRIDEIDLQNPVHDTFACRAVMAMSESEAIPGPGPSAANVYVSALTYCTTMTTCPSGLSVTVYQMVKLSDGRWRR
jgi:hypothetical protein